MQDAIVVDVVRLESGDYSVDVGTIGAIEEVYGEDEDTSFFIRWVTPGGGIGSGPIRVQDVVSIGKLAIPVPEREATDATKTS